MVVRRGDGNRSSLTLIVAAFVVVASACRGETATDRPRIVDSTLSADSTLSPDMIRLSEALFARTRAPLEHTGHSFYALGMFLTSDGRLAEVGPQSTTAVLAPFAIADGIRENFRSSHLTDATVVGVVFDSIAGDIAKAGSGALLEQPPRQAVLEMEDRAGRCVRIEREYRFVSAGGGGASEDAGGPSGFGVIEYHDAIRLACRPRDYWSVGGTTP